MPSTSIHVATNGKILFSFCGWVMAPHSRTLAWKIPWLGEPGRLQSMGSLRIGHNWATSLSLFTFMHWTRKWQPTPVFLPGESQGRGSLVAAVYGVAQSRTRLKRLSSSSIPLLCMYHFFFICSSVDGHSGFFPDSAVVNNAAVNIAVHASYSTSDLNFFQ